MLTKSKIQSLKPAIMVLAILFAFAVVAPSQISVLNRPLFPIWEVQLTGISASTFDTTTEQIYIASQGGKLSALAGKEGAILWRIEVGGEVSTEVSAEERGIYVATRRTTNTDEADIGQHKGTLRCLNPATGLTLWATDLMFPLVGKLNIETTLLVARDERGVLFAFDKTTGKIRWQHQDIARFTTHIAVSNGMLYVGAEGGKVVGINALSGQARWQQSLDEVNLTAIAAEAGRVYIGTSLGKVHALDSTNGLRVWRKEFSRAIRFIALCSNGALVASANNALHLVETKRGKRIWKRDLPGRIASQPLVAGDAVLISPLSYDSCIVLHAPTGRIINTIPLSSENRAPINLMVSKDSLIIATEVGVITYSSIK